MNLLDSLAVSVLIIVMDNGKQGEFRWQTFTLYCFIGGCDSSFHALTLIPPLTNVSAQVVPPGSVARMWHGRVPTAKAEEYTTYITEAGLKKIRKIEGNLGLQMFRRTANVAKFYVIY